jgi:SAM-dependent methyltransferase
MSEAERFWEQHYRARPPVPAGDVGANAVLLEVAGQLAPGRALDLGCGGGGDALWLARRGWHVTAIDVSPTALARVAQRAADEGLADRVAVERHDLARTVPTGAFDLVTAQYLQSPVAFPRAQVIRSIAPSVTVGGLLLVVDHGSVPPWSWADPETVFPTPQEVLDSLDLPTGQWRPERLDAPRREAHGPDGRAAVVIDTILALRRTGQ